MAKIEFTTYTYIHTYLHTYIHTYIHIYTHMNTYIHTHIYAHVHIYIHIHTHIHTHTHTHIQALKAVVVRSENWPVSKDNLSIKFYKNFKEFTNNILLDKV
jgi:hypothetical protein